MLADRIKNLRRALGITQGQLAERWGTTTTTVARWETGSPPSGPILRLLEMEERQIGDAPDWGLAHLTDDPYIPTPEDIERDNRRIKAFSALLNLKLWGMVEDEMQRLWKTIGAGHGSVFEPALRQAVRNHWENSPIGTDATGSRFQTELEKLEAIAEMSDIDAEAFWGQNEAGFAHRNRQAVIDFLASHPELDN